MWRTQVNVVYVLLLVCLTSFTDVKLGPMQVSEFVSLFGLIVVGPMLLFSSRLPEKGTDRAAVVAIFLFFCFVMFSAAVAYFNAGFLPPSDSDGLLKQPGWISVARVFQLLLVYSCFSCIVFTAMQDREIVGRCIRLYIYGLTFSSLYGIVSFALMAGAGIEIGGAYGEYGVRLRAFFVEGGPFGLFAASGLLLVAAQWRWSFLSRRKAIVCASIIMVALLLAQSKAAIFAMFLTLVMALFFTGFRALRAYFLPVMGAMLVVVVLALFAGAAETLSDMAEGRAALVSAPDVARDDPNLIAGRIAGSLIVPEMIAAHPALGIGIGNYSLLRNSAEYNRVLPILDFWDLHGLGLYGFTAEVGIIAILFFAVFLLMPALSAKHAQAPFAVVMLCCFPLIAFMFGVQPTFLYPWVVCALGVALVREYCE